MREIGAFAQGLAAGEAVPAAAAVGIAGIVLVEVLQRWFPQVPAVLVMVVLATAATSVLDLADHGVGLIGELPQGFPPFSVPDVRVSDLGPLLAGAVGIALIALADTISTASSFAARTGQEIRGNQEMLGIGTANLAAGLFQGFPVSTSGSRTAVAERAGAKTQLTGVVGAALIVLMIVLVPGLLRNLPQPALAAVVITASLSLADGPGTARLWRQRKVEFFLSVFAFLGVALLGVLPGIGIAVALSILNVFRRAWLPYQTVLGQVDGIEGYHDVHSYPQARRLPGLVIYRFDAPLFFANARTFRDEIRHLSRSEPKPRWIVIAAEPITDVDTTASDVLFELDRELDRHGTALVFAELKDPVRRKIDRYGLARAIEPDHFFPTVEAAVATYRSRTGATWTPTRRVRVRRARRRRAPGGRGPATGPVDPPGQLTGAALCSPAQTVVSAPGRAATAGSPPARGTGAPRRRGRAGRARSAGSPWRAGSGPCWGGSAAAARPRPPTLGVVPRPQGADQEVPLLVPLLQHGTEDLVREPEGEVGCRGDQGRDACLAVPPDAVLARGRGVPGEPGLAHRLRGVDDRLERLADPDAPDRERGEVADQSSTRWVRGQDDEAGLAVGLRAPRRVHAEGGQRPLRRRRRALVLDRPRVATRRRRSGPPWGAAGASATSAKFWPAVLIPLNSDARAASRTRALRSSCSVSTSR